MNIVKELIERRGINQKILSYEIGVSQPTVSDWCSGKKRPKGPNVDKLSEYFGVSKGVIMGFDKLPEDAILALDNSFISINRHSVPIVGEIACGTPITADENIEGYADVPQGIRADFALRCKGDSMAPTFLDGDLVLIRKQPDVDDGQIAAVLIDGEATLKHVYHQQAGLLLIADNAKYAPIQLHDDGFDCISIQGRAVGFVRIIVEE